MTYLLLDFKKICFSCSQIVLTFVLKLKHDIKSQVKMTIQVQIPAVKTYSNSTRKAKHNVRPIYTETCSKLP